MDWDSRCELHRMFRAWDCSGAGDEMARIRADIAVYVSDSRSVWVVHNLLDNGQGRISDGGIWQRADVCFIHWIVRCRWTDIVQGGRNGGRLEKLKVD